MTTQVFWLSLILTAGWGSYLVVAINEYRLMHDRRERRRAEIIRAFRRVVVAFCIVSFHAAFFVRTGLVLMGVGDGVAGLVTFYALVGIDVTGMIYCLVSLRFD